jgi:multicomponent Na+:H+ antiporter subunit A
VVVGLVLDVLRSLGAEIDEHFEQRAADPASDLAGVEQDFAGDASVSDARSNGQQPGGVAAETTSRGQS